MRAQDFVKSSDHKTEPKKPHDEYQPCIHMQRGLELHPERTLLVFDTLRSDFKGPVPRGRYRKKFKAQTWVALEQVEFIKVKKLVSFCSKTLIMQYTI